MADNIASISLGRFVEVAPKGGQSNAITIHSDDGDITVESSPKNISISDKGIQGAIRELTNPEFTYTDGLLTSVLYSGNETKAITYIDGVISQVVFDNGVDVVTKTFNYTDGVLTSILEV